MRDIEKGDPQVDAIVAVIVSAAPDVLLIQGFDHDLEGHALAAFADQLADAGLELPYLYAGRPNTGVQVGADMDGDGRLGEPEDALSYGAFRGQGGAALLSAFPLGVPNDMTALLWAELPFARLPQVDGAPYYSPEILARLPLSSVVHWEVPVQAPGGWINVLAWHGQTPVFDGPEDRNGLRGADETLFWQRYLDGEIEERAEGAFVVMGTSNIDPVDGDGRHEAMRSLLDDPRLTDPAPASAGAKEAADPDHIGDPALDTVSYANLGPGNLRIDYVLPSSALDVVGAGVVWPTSDDPFAEIVTTASRHRLVWVDVRLPP